MKTLKIKGFTMIELVIVIVLIGILAATALPKFANMSGQARTAAAQGVSGALGSAVTIVHAQWIASGSPAVGSSVLPLTLEGQNIYTSATGWPEHTTAAGDGTMTEAKCLALWNGLLSGPPSAATATAGCTGTCQYSVTAPTASTCRFADQQGTTGGNAIGYDITTGVVSLGTTP